MEVKDKFGKPTDLPLFDSTAICPKCLSDDVHARWQSGTYRCYGRPCTLYSNGSLNKACTFEHIDRHCRRCSYEWVELPLDL